MSELERVYKQVNGEWTWVTEEASGSTAVGGTAGAGRLVLLHSYPDRCMISRLQIVILGRGSRG